MTPKDEISQKIIEKTGLSGNYEVALQQEGATTSVCGAPRNCFGSECRCSHCEYYPYQCIRCLKYIKDGDEFRDGRDVLCDESCNKKNSKCRIPVSCDYCLDKIYDPDDEFRIGRKVFCDEFCSDYWADNGGCTKCDAPRNGSGGSSCPCGDCKQHPFQCDYCLVYHNCKQVISGWKHFCDEVCENAWNNTGGNPMPVSNTRYVKCGECYAFVPAHDKCSKWERWADDECSKCKSYTQCNYINCAHKIYKDHAFMRGGNLFCNEDCSEAKMRMIIKKDGQEYAVIISNIGDGRVELDCFDDVDRVGSISGKLRREVWLNNGDIVLVGLREFDQTKADILYKYTEEEARKLRFDNFFKNVGKELFW